jgi:flagellar biosynthesis/type III secretory pathway M-ring protein FliF/YscJ
VAQKVEVVLVDDLDGAPAAETVPFGVDGRHYEIDLSAINAKQLRKEMKAYIGKARTIAPPNPRQEAAVIRQWAKANGYEVSARGRLHRDIVEAYRNATFP